MSPQRQEELTKIASEVIQHASDGLTSPTDALVKVAQDHSLNRHEIQRIAEAYNASAQLALMKQAKEDDNVEIDDVIPLADGTDAADKIFGSVSEAVEGDKKDDMLDPGEYKTDALLKAASAVTPEAMTFCEPAARPVAQRKVAAAPVGTVVERSPEEQLDYLVKKAEGQLSALKKEHSLIVDEAASAKYAALKSIDAFSERMHRNDAPDFSHVEKTAKALHSGMGIVCDTVYKGCGLATIGHGRYTGDLPKYASVDDYKDEVDELSRVRDNMATAAVKYAEADSILTQCEKLQYQLRTAFSGQEKVAVDPVGMMLERATQRAMSGPAEADKIVERHVGKPNEELRTQLGGDRMQVALSDLTQNDPVISQYAKQPGTIETAFNELVTLRPGLADQPAVLRAALRRYLTSGGDMTVQEAGQLSSIPMEKGLHTT